MSGCFLLHSNLAFITGIAYITVLNTQASIAKLLSEGLSCYIKSTIMATAYFI